MTRINDYIWHLPHDPEPDDPADVGVLAQIFNNPIVDRLSGPLGDSGYTVSANDIMVKLDEMADNMHFTYYANVHFVKYLRPDVLTRVHFRHDMWARFLPTADTHTYFIHLDRFKIADQRTKQTVPMWEGRLHTRMSNMPGEKVQFDGDDQIWRYGDVAELDQQLALFLDKFSRAAQPWLESMLGIS